ncbi:ABC transporter substrate-binding protein [Tissierella sp. MSJ-40]|uniref:ABC transporter substrate-binding protein n=1 Tax=Tissierella simiarum TaxID=2841534 RepID=A0ABS6E939_9FIRM|nr:ABC transporter substrate-binding protein [Tissierella simiarum]MBU5439442.1 ABC transporter substrate-binding protein [Tissierella simiarum]
MRRKLSLFLVIVLCCGLFAGCAKENKVNETEKVEEANTESDTADTPKVGGTFVVSMAREPQTYNPCAQADDAAYVIIQNMFNKLVKINGDDKVIPDIAKEWEYSDDGKTLTFHLQENVKWHDGEKFSSEDVKWTFDQIIKEKGFASASLAGVEEITCPDENTVVFKLEAPNSGLLGYIAWFGTYIMPKHIYEGTDWLQNSANQSPIGTGPFKFVEHKKGESITIERNDDYWGHKPYLDKIVYTIIPDQNTAFQGWLNGEIDESRNGVPLNEAHSFDDDPNYVVKEKLWPNKLYINFNLREGKFADIKVRQAVAYGIDRDEIFTKALKGIGQKAEYFISPIYDWAINEDVKLPERDVEKARALLEEAGYKADENGIYFSTTMDLFPGFDDVAEVIKANFKDIGIDMKINVMDDPAYDEKVWFGHDYEITMIGGYQGPDISAISSRIESNGSMNIGGYNNPKIDELLKQGLVLTTEEERAPIYKEIQEILAEDLPVIFYSEKGAKLVVKSYVKGHPATEASDKASEAEFTYVWLDK